MLNRLAAIFASTPALVLAILYLASVLGISRSPRGEPIWFVSGIAIYSLLFLWPLCVRLNLYQGNFSKGGVLLNFAGKLSYIMAIMFISAQYFFSYNFNDFFQNGILQTLPLCFIIVSLFLLYYSFYILSTSDDTELIFKLLHGIKYMLVSVMFPIGIFYLRNRIDVYVKFRESQEVPQPR